MKDKNQWMKSYAPLGLDITKERGGWIFCMVVSTCWCLTFLGRYLDYRSQLFEIRGNRKILIEGAKMPNFEFLTKDLFEVFGVVLIFCALIIVYHYYYHYQGSKMMYLMRRLPNKWEVHVRCFTLPVVAGVISIIYMMVLRLLFFAIYYWCTPVQCLSL